MKLQLYNTNFNMICFLYHLILISIEVVQGLDTWVYDRRLRVRVPQFGIHLFSVLKVLFLFSLNLVYFALALEGKGFFLILKHLPRVKKNREIFKRTQFAFPKSNSFFVALEGKQARHIQAQTICSFKFLFFLVSTNNEEIKRD